jgi:hypothetical protein
MSTIKSSSEHLTLNADGSGKDINLQANGSTKVTVKSDGNVGIGCSPSASLHIQDTTPELRFTYTGNSGYAHIKSDADAALIFSTGTTTGTERLRIQSGGGISFNGDTAAANALDDYEEGTWTPVIGSGTINVNSATYTKIGNLVHVIAYINTFSDTSSGTYISVSGLPFTSASTGYNHGILKTAYFANQNNVCCYIGQSSATMYFHEFNSNADYEGILYSAINNSTSATRIFASITYRTAT